MRGLRLFIRPIESDDRDAITAFLRTNGTERPAPACGLLAKLLGDLVGVLAIEITADAIRVDHLTIRGDLRRKRIGRFMLGELDEFARKMERTQLVVAEPGTAREFLRRVGFSDDEGGAMVRKVK